jgi:hypothetical protein
MVTITVTLVPTTLDCGLLSVVVVGAWVIVIGTVGDVLAL